MPRKYDREFKMEAVRMALEPGVRAKDVERRLGIGTGVLSRWTRQGQNELRLLDDPLDVMTRNSRSLDEITSIKRKCE